jgi:hypothetical protein
MKEIKLTKVSNAPYKCHAVYEWEGHTIYADDGCFSGGKCYWYCDTLFKNSSFRTLKGIKKAIKLKQEGKLSWLELQWCEEE